MPDYTVGRGRLLFQKKGTNGYRDIGNAPNVNMAMTQETLDHFNSQSGLRKKDARIILEQAIAMTFTLDEPNSENLELFFMGKDTVENTVAAGSVTAEAITARLDKLVKLANYNITQGTVAITGLTEGTDFEVLYAQGWIKIFSGGATLEGAALTVDYDHTGVTTKQVKAATTTTIEGDMRFLGDPAAGRIIDVHAYVSLQSEGEFGLVTDAWTEMGFNAEALNNSNYDGLAEIWDRGEVVAA